VFACRRYALRDKKKFKFRTFLDKIAPSLLVIELKDKGRPDLEWLQYFNEQKTQATILQQMIQQTDKEIDALVYELYGLNEEEIKIVEGKQLPPAQN
jgi:hypothetical protein